MRIDIRRIPAEGLILTQDFDPKALDLETDFIRFASKLRATAQVSRITNAVTVEMALNSRLHTTCSRCLNEVEIDFNKDIRLNYPADEANPVIDLDPQIREEIILEYPVKPLCKPDCKGLCVKCGKNLNEGGCSCGTT